MGAWGYTTCGDVPAILTPQEFRALTGNKVVSTDEALKPMLEAVSASIRSYCGWHIAPELSCSWIGEATGKIVRLPAMAVEVEEVRVSGHALDESAYEWTQQGLIRLHTCAPQAWRSVEVDFLAGVDVATEIGAVVAQIASNAIVARPGVAEEHAGQVGMTFNQTGTGITGGVSILSRDKALLEPWRIRRV